MGGRGFKEACRKAPAFPPVSPASCALLDALPEHLLHLALPTLWQSVPAEEVLQRRLPPAGLGHNAHRPPGPHQLQLMAQLKKQLLFAFFGAGFLSPSPPPPALAFSVSWVLYRSLY